MSNEMDELLEKLKTEYTQKKKAQASSTPPPQKRSQPRKKPISSSKKAQSETSMDQMLDDLRNELEAGGGRSKKTQKKPSSPSKEPVNRERLIAEIEKNYLQQESYREQKRAEARRKEQELLAEQERQRRELIAQQERAKKREQRRKEAMRQQAAEWLKKLNPRSEEGRWFEEFSYSYESKLEAAIDYLEAMRESGL